MRSIGTLLRLLIQSSIVLKMRLF